MPPEDQEARRKVQHCVSLVTFENLHAKLKEIVDNLTLQLHKLWNELPLTKDQPWSWKSYPSRAPASVTENRRYRIGYLELLKVLKGSRRKSPLHQILGLKTTLALGLES